METAIKREIIVTAAFYGRELIDDVVDLYWKELKDLPLQRVLNAFAAYRRDPKNKTAPLPAQIRELCEPAISPEKFAINTATKIIGAVRRFGWSNPSLAENYIGKKGWKAVQEFGGWVKFCQNLKPGDEGIVRAQLRDYIKSNLEMQYIEKQLEYENRKEIGE